MTWLASVPGISDTDAERLLAAFLPKAFRRPVQSDEIDRFTKITIDAMAEKKPLSVHQVMLLAYTAALCSPDFLFFKERKARLTTTPSPVDSPIT